MKKTVRIFGIALLTTALAFNVQYALCDYYGIKDNHLNKQVWAQTRTVASLLANATSTDGTITGTTTQTFENGGIGAGTSGTLAADNYVRHDQYITCANTTATISYSTTVNGSLTGKASLEVDEGLYKGSIGLEGTVGAGTAVSASITATITYPVNTNGTPMQFLQTWCFPNGHSDCIGSANPCITMAMAQINTSIAAGLNTSQN